MRTLGMAVIFICTLAFIVIRAMLVGLSLNLFTLQNLTDFLGLAFRIENLDLFIGGIGLFIVIASIFIAQLTLGKMSSEKTIAFNNPDGQVTVSLSAIEDFIKRLSADMVGIRDLRSNVVAGKKAIEINIRLSLWAEANIPETTENIQSIIKNRIQEMLGIEEPIVVRVHVGRIVQKEKKRPKKKEKQDLVEKPATFRGNIEYGKG